MVAMVAKIVIAVLAVTVKSPALVEVRDRVIVCLLTTNDDPRSVSLWGLFGVVLVSYRLAICCFGVAMTVELTLKKVPDQIKSLINREAQTHRRSINQEAIVLLEEALLARARDAGVGRSEADAILARYAALPTRDARSESEVIEYDAIGLPK